MLALLHQGTDPIWHSVSCVCEGCLKADEMWITRYSYTLHYGKRPLFNQQPR